METNKLDLLAKDIDYIKKSIDQLTGSLEKNYVTKDQFEPVQKVVYGLVTIILATVVGALLILVIRK